MRSGDCHQTVPLCGVGVWRERNPAWECAWAPAGLLRHFGEAWYLALRIGQTLTRRCSWIPDQIRDEALVYAVPWCLLSKKSQARCFEGKRRMHGGIAPGRPLPYPPYARDPRCQLRASYVPGTDDPRSGPCPTRRTPE
jgi:hypothetical protein